MATNPVPSVHRSVHYFDREEIVNAHNQKRAPEPFAAVITRVHRDKDGTPTGVVGLAVFDPEIGYQVKHDVLQGADYAQPEANRWYFTPYQSSAKASPAGAEHPRSAQEAELVARIERLEELVEGALNGPQSSPEQPANNDHEQDGA